MTGIRLLVDENLSEVILGWLGADYPGSMHVRPTIGTGASDQAIWEHARANGLVVLTRDEDFQRLSVLHGAPPKVVYLAGHNLANSEVVDLLRAARSRIARFVADETLALLVLDV
ncbi:MAG: DUF5615 family PIN-like protein [Planctomycetota bacterium]